MGNHKRTKDDLLINWYKELMASPSEKAQNTKALMLKTYAQGVDAGVKLGRLGKPA